MYNVNCSSLAFFRFEKWLVFLNDNFQCVLSLMGGIKPLWADEGGVNVFNVERNFMKIDKKISYEIV